MNENNKTRNIIRIVVAVIFIGAPLVIMYYNIVFGGFLLVIGLIITARAIRVTGNQDIRTDRMSQLRKANASGKTILVQIVDDFGRELPPQEAERLLAEARAKADPRDMVIGVKFKVNSDDEKSK